VSLVVMMIVLPLYALLALILIKLTADTVKVLSRGPKQVDAESAALHVERQLRRDVWQGPIALNNDGTLIAANRVWVFNEGEATVDGETVGPVPADVQVRVEPRAVLWVTDERTVALPIGGGS
jgi:hypothetical protein